MNASRWTWPDRIAVPAALLVAEATWATLLVDASLTRPHIHVGILAFVLPTAAVIAGAGLYVRLFPRRSLRLAMTTATTLVIISVAAGLIGIGLTHESFITLAGEPWLVKGTRPIECAWTAWPIAVVCGVRGWWLGARPVSFRPAAFSASLGTAAFVLLFIVDAVDPDPKVHRALASMSWSTAIFIACTMAGLVAIRRREIESGARRKASVLEPTTRDLTGPGLVVILTAAAVLISVALGFLAPDVAHGVAATCRAIAAAIRWLVLHIPRGHHPTASSSGSAPRRSTAPGTTIAPASKAVSGADLGIVFAALAVLALALGVLATIRARLLLLRHRAMTIEPPDDAGESDSVFSWRHLFGQLWALLRGRFTRSTRADTAPCEHDRRAEVDEESVRGEYRRLLRAAAREGAARSADETATEFEHRLAGHLAGRSDARADLGNTTRAYELVRYGEGDDGELTTLVRAQVNRVVEALSDAAAAKHPNK